MLAPHLTVDAMCPRFSKKEIREILVELCRACEMHAISKPHVDTVSGADYNPGETAKAAVPRMHVGAGFGNIFIEFSNITIHTFERGNKTSINVDIFSCKEFDKKKILKFLKQKGLTKISSRRIRRDIMVL